MGINDKKTKNEKNRLYSIGELNNINMLQRELKVKNGIFRDNKGRKIAVFALYAVSSAHKFYCYSS